jgi:uncharacterized membrane protein
MIVRSTGNKIALGFSIACLLCMVVSLAVFIYLIGSKGMQDVLTASAMATTLFFASCTTVLFFMSKPPRHELQPWDEKEGARYGSSGVAQP